MSISLRSCFLATRYYRMLEHHILPGLLQSGVTPNQLTVAGSLLALGVPLGFYAHPAAGLGLLLLSATADSLDGLLARALNRHGPFGAFLDSSLDRFSDALYLVGVWMLFPSDSDWPTATLLIFAALLLTSMISYVKARAEALGVECRVGCMERGVRVVYLIAWVLVLILLPASRSEILWGGLTLYLGLTLATVMQRMRHIRSQMIKG